MKLHIITPSKLKVETIEVANESSTNRFLRHLPFIGHHFEPTSRMTIAGRHSFTEAKALIRNREEFKYVEDCIMRREDEIEDLDYVVNNEDGSKTIYRHYHCIPIDIKDAIVTLSVNHVEVIVVPA